MQTLTLILEFVLIIALGAVWWMARRDLLMLVTRQQTPTLREMENVQATIEQLLERLEAKSEEAELRISARLSDSQTSIDTARVKAPSVRDARPEPAPRPAKVVLGEADSAARYAEVYRLADAGLDADEIAHKTGLGSGEVRLVISLRPS